jgi:hypothetical protein
MYFLLVNLIYKIINKRYNLKYVYKFDIFKNYGDSVSHI